VRRRQPIPSFTSEFHEEFEAQTHALLRRRFQWFSGLLSLTSVALLIMSLLAGLAALDLPALAKIIPSANAMAPSREKYLAWAAMLAAIFVYFTCYLLARRGRFGRDGLLRLTYLLVVVDGVLRVGAAWANVPGTLGFMGVMLTHSLACLFLPWTPSQALRPLIPVVCLEWVRIVLGGHDAGTLVVLLLFSPLVGAPGTLFCLLRHSRRTEEFKLRFFQKRYGEVRRELVDARRIHESLFPSQLIDGPIRFTYQYEPMHLIGGDYLFAFRSRPAPDAPLSIVVMDVTGHGIPAALTVNRLHGELSRIFAEEPGIRPGAVLSLLNRYVHLTLANHSVYVTALCLKFDLDRDQLEYASGGHPPAYVKGVDKTVHELVSTAYVLGACADAEFKPEPVTVRFGPGDALIAYTDGALEARNDDRKMIGLDGMRRIVASGRTDRAGDWPRQVLAAVESHRSGPPEDDTLVIEVMRPIEAAQPVITTTRQRDAVRT
jgi:serine phosphatase RsbU (regulator of sigma subunit)